MYYHRAAVAAFQDAVPAHDCQWLGTPLGSCQGQALWESLAILVGARFLCLAAGRADDSKPRWPSWCTAAAAQRALPRLRSRDDRVNMVARELGLYLAIKQVRSERRRAD